MNLLIAIILCVLINILGNFLIKKCKELIQIIKFKKTVSQFNQFNLEDFNINKTDKDFWNDLKTEDIDNEKN